MDIRSEDETWFEVFDMAHQKNPNPANRLPDQDENEAALAIPTLN